jgi:hypothetical protein
MRPAAGHGSWAGFGERRERYADAGYLGRAGEWHVGLQQGASQRNQYASAEGSLTLLDGSLHALRYIQQGMALVSTHGIGHVPVMLENRPAGETDEDGYLLLTDLPRYHNSKVSINPLDLPADVIAPSPTCMPGRATTARSKSILTSITPSRFRPGWSTAAAGRSRWAASCQRRRVPPSWAATALSGLKIRLCRVSW